MVGAGDRLGSNYVLGRVLGRGSMGVVHAAQALAAGEDVAVKILHPHLASDLAIVGRFVQERQVLERVDHENVVRVRDLVVDLGHVGIVMEHVPGTDLRRLLSQRSLDAGEAVDLTRQLASGLHAIHSNGIVHRDLKPGNVLVTPGPVLIPKITDFGISHLTDPDHAVGTFVGTPRYMAPEALTEGTRIGPSFDIYALGLTLYEMLIGAPPFIVEGSIANLQAHRNHPPPTVGGVPAALTQLIDGMLSKQPEVRPEADEVRAVLDDIVADIDPDEQPYRIEPKEEEAVAAMVSAAYDGLFDAVERAEAFAEVEPFASSEPEAEPESPFDEVVEPVAADDAEGGVGQVVEESALEESAAEESAVEEGSELEAGALGQVEVDVFAEVEPYAGSEAEPVVEAGNGVEALVGVDLFADVGPYPGPEPAVEIDQVQVESGAAAEVAPSEAVAAESGVDVFADVEPYPGPEAPGGPVVEPALAAAAESPVAVDATDDADADAAAEPDADVESESEAESEVVIESRLEELGAARLDPERHRRKKRRPRPVTAFVALARQAELRRAGTDPDGSEFVDPGRPASTFATLARLQAERHRDEEDDQSSFDITAGRPKSDMMPLDASTAAGCSPSSPESEGPTPDGSDVAGPGDEPDEVSEDASETDDERVEAVEADADVDADADGDADQEEAPAKEPAPMRASSAPRSTDGFGRQPSSSGRFGAREMVMASAGLAVAGVIGLLAVLNGQEGEGLPVDLVPASELEALSADDDDPDPRSSDDEEELALPVAPSESNRSDRDDASRLSTFEVVGPAIGGSRPAIDTPTLGSRVPPIVGRSAGAAEAALEAAGLVVVVVEQAGEANQLGRVIRSDPQPGSRAEAGSEVTIWVAVP